MTVPRHDGWDCLMHVQYVQAAHYDALTAELAAHKRLNAELEASDIRLRARVAALEAETPRAPPPKSWIAAMKSHGHVFPSERGVIARCGGPFICQQCACEKALQDAMLYGNGWLCVDATGRMHYQRAESIAIIQPDTKDQS